MEHKIEYNPDKHEYLVNGVIVPSVNQIIMDVLGNPFNSQDSAYYADRGSRVHAAIGNILQDNIPVIEDDIAGFLESAYKWHKKENPNILFIETPLYNSELNYCGTPDLVTGDIEKDKAITIWDFKTGGYHNRYNLQLMAYELILKSCYPSLVEINRKLIMLSKSGKPPRIINCRDSNDSNVFLSIHTVYNWKNKNSKEAICL